MIVETISKKRKKEKEDYGDKKQARTNKTNSTSGSKRGLLINTTHTRTQKRRRRGIGYHEVRERGRVKDVEENS
jgi:hypothetical protein